MGFNFKSFGKKKNGHNDRDDDDSNPFHGHDYGGYFDDSDFFVWNHHNGNGHGSGHHHGHGNGYGNGHGNGGGGNNSNIEMSLLGTFDSGLGEAAAEIVAHDPQSQRLVRHQCRG